MDSSPTNQVTGPSHCGRRGHRRGPGWAESRNLLFASLECFPSGFFFPFWGGSGGGLDQVSPGTILGRLPGRDVQGGASGFPLCPASALVEQITAAVTGFPRVPRNSRSFILAPSCLREDDQLVERYSLMFWLETKALGESVRAHQMHMFPQFPRPAAQKMKRRSGRNGRPEGTNISSRMGSWLLGCFVLVIFCLS